MSGDQTLRLTELQLEILGLMTDQWLAQWRVQMAVHGDDVIDPERYRALCDLQALVEETQQ